MTRIEQARRRVTIARYAIAVTAAAALAAFAAAARASHPGTSEARRPTTAQRTAQSDESSPLFDDDGSFSIGPSGGAAPQIQSGGS